MKKCSKCGEWKEESQYHRDRQKRSGRRPSCKDCASKRGKKYRQKNRERLNKKARQRHRRVAKQWRAVPEEEWQRIERTQSKECSQCGKVKKLSEFHRHVGHTDGHANSCKPCQAERFRDWYEDNADSVREYARQYRQDNKDKRNEYYEQRRQENPNWQRARIAVHYAAKKGDIPHISTQDCMECGQQAVHYHHHKGYAKEHWLDVVPLCAPCHAKERRVYS